jgi:hypothetical protein
MLYQLSYTPSKGLVGETPPLVQTSDAPESDGPAGASDLVTAGRVV